MNHVARSSSAELDKGQAAGGLSLQSTSSQQSWMSVVSTTVPACLSMTLLAQQRYSNLPCLLKWGRLSRGKTHASCEAKRTRGMSSFMASLARAAMCFLMLAVGALLAHVTVPSCTG